jgi:hypothetical protein
LQLITLSNTHTHARARAHTHTHTHTHTRQVSSGRGIGPSQRILQHSQETDIHVNEGIRTRNPSKRAATDPCLKPRGHSHNFFFVFISALTFRLSDNIFCLYLLYTSCLSPCPILKKVLNLEQKRKCEIRVTIRGDLSSD